MAGTNQGQWRPPGIRTPGARASRTHRVDRRRIDGRWAGGRGGAGRRPVHPGRRECPHRCGVAWLRVRLGVVGCAVGRGSATSRNAGRRRRRCSWASPVCALTRSGRPSCTCVSAGCGHRYCSRSWSGVSSGPAGRCPAEPAVAGLPVLAGLALVRDRRRLRDRRRVDRRGRLPHARSADRRGRAPAAPVLHRLGQPHGRAGARSGRGLLGPRLGLRRR